MLTELNWKTLEDRRTISRLTLLYKSANNIAAINIDEHYTNHEKKEILQPEKLPQFPLLSLLPERIATGTHLSLGLWNRLPATIREAPSVDIYEARLCSIKLFTHLTR